MNLVLSPLAHWHLSWMTNVTDKEVSSMGLLKPGKELFVEDFIFMKQKGGTASTDPDMSWWAAKQAELYDKFGVHPWQLNCWTHTHPSGVTSPSQVDEDTMNESFGDCDWAIMLIAVKKGGYYCRLEADVKAGEAVQRIRLPLQLVVRWNAAPAYPITADTIARWEKEFDTLFSETGYTPATSTKWESNYCDREDYYGYGYSPHWQRRTGFGHKTKSGGFRGKRIIKVGSAGFWDRENQEWIMEDTEDEKSNGSVGRNGGNGSGGVGGFNGGGKSSGISTRKGYFRTNANGEKEWIDADRTSVAEIRQVGAGEWESRAVGGGGGSETAGDAAAAEDNGAEPAAVSGGAGSKKKELAK